MSTLHAHYESYSSDCDGSYTQTYIMVMNDDERASDFGDIEFHERVLSSVVNIYSLYRSGTLRVDCLDESSTEKRLSWSEQTEEGQRWVEATICTDDCNLEEPSLFRDHRAEEMGY